MSITPATTVDSGAGKSVTHTYHLTNNFQERPTWNYPSYYDIYCTGGHTIPGGRNTVFGTLYIIQYLVYATLYIPSLIVISHPPLIDHSCYKLMFAVGVMDNVLGFSPPSSPACSPSSV